MLNLFLKNSIIFKKSKVDLDHVTVYLVVRQLDCVIKSGAWLQVKQHMFEQPLVVHVGYNMLAPVQVTANMYTNFACLFGLVMFAN